MKNNTKRLAMINAYETAIKVIGDNLDQFNVNDFPLPEDYINFKESTNKVIKHLHTKLKVYTDVKPR